MKKLLIFSLFAFSDFVFSQDINQFSPFDAKHWGLVLQNPEMQKVKITKDITYQKVTNAEFHFDLYSRLSLKIGQKIPTIIFLTAFGNQPNQAKSKDWEIYQTWPKLIATQGFMGISMEIDGSRIHESYDALFNFLTKNGHKYGIDADRLGVYAASANTSQSGAYLMKENISKGIKAAVLYYGNMPTVPLRKDLPVLFVVSEGDVRGNTYQNVWTEILKNKAPWTVKMASNMPHAFDSFSDNDEARILIKETISFWKNHLEPVPQPEWQKQPERAIVEAQYWRNDTKTIELLENWFKLNPNTNDKSAYELYGRSLVNAGRFTEGEAIHKKRYEKIDSANPYILFDLVVVSHALDKQQQAANYLAEYAQKLPLQKNNYTGLAFNLYRLKKYDEAIVYFEKALDIEANANDYYNLACNYALINNKNKAFEGIENAIKMGKVSKQNYENDPDLDSLKVDKRWKEILGKLQ